jgi:hypothetical protein
MFGGASSPPGGMAMPGIGDPGTLALAWTMPEDAPGLAPPAIWTESRGTLWDIIQAVWEAVLGAL